MISKSLEEYIKSMYVLKMQNEIIRVTDVANKMGVSKASVNKAVKNLQEEKLVNYESYKDIELTAKRWRISKKDLRSLWYWCFIF